MNNFNKKEVKKGLFIYTKRSFSMAYYYILVIPNHGKFMLIGKNKRQTIKSK